MSVAMDKRSSVELLNLEKDNSNYNKSLGLDSYHSDSKSSSLNSKQETVRKYDPYTFSCI